MHAKKFLVAIVGALAIGLTITPASALTTGSVLDHDGPGLVIRHSCSNFDGDGGFVFQPGYGGWCHGVEEDEEAELDDFLLVWGGSVECDDDENPLVLGHRLVVFRSGLWFECEEEHEELFDDEVLVLSPHDEDDGDGTSTVTAINTGLLGTAIAVSNAEEVETSNVTALNTGFLGTAIAVSNAEEVDNSNVTAINTGVLGTAIAISNAEEVDNSNVTAINTGILGTAIAVGGGGGEVDGPGFAADETARLGPAISSGASEFAGDVLSTALSTANVSRGASSVLPIGLALT